MSVDDARNKLIIFNNDNKFIINTINLDCKILMLINFFRFKMKLLAYHINFNNLIDYIINITIDKHRLFTIDKMIIKHIKKFINYIKVNMLIEMNIRLLLCKKNLKINCKSPFLKINR